MYEKKCLSLKPFTSFYFQTISRRDNCWLFFAEVSWESNFMIALFFWIPAHFQLKLSQQLHVWQVKCIGTMSLSKSHWWMGYMRHHRPVFCFNSLSNTFGVVSCSWSAYMTRPLHPTHCPSSWSCIHHGASLSSSSTHPRPLLPRDGAWIPVLLCWRHGVELPGTLPAAIPNQKSNGRSSRRPEVYPHGNLNKECQASHEPSTFARGRQGQQITCPSICTIKSVSSEIWRSGIAFRPESSISEEGWFATTAQGALTGTNSQKLEVGVACRGHGFCELGFCPWLVGHLPRLGKRLACQNNAKCICTYLHTSKRSSQTGCWCSHQSTKSAWQGPQGRQSDPQAPETSLERNDWKKRLQENMTYVHSAISVTMFMS